MFFHSIFPFALMDGEFGDLDFFVPKSIRCTAIVTFPLRDLHFGFVATDAVTFLDTSQHLVALAGNDVHIVVG
jgi:hypothetical protein